VFCIVLYTTVVHNDKHTWMSSSYSSLDWFLSHWVHFTVHSLDLFVFICVYFVLLFFILHIMLCYCQHNGVDLMGLKPGP